MTNQKLKTFTKELNILSQNNPAELLNRVKESIIANYPNDEPAELLKKSILTIEHLQELVSVKNGENDS